MILLGIRGIEATVVTALRLNSAPVSHESFVMMIEDQSRFTEVFQVIFSSRIPLAKLYSINNKNGGEGTLSKGHRTRVGW
jgi:hypothetical protein